MCGIDTSGQVETHIRDQGNHGDNICLTANNQIDLCEQEEENKTKVLQTVRKPAKSSSRATDEILSRYSEKDIPSETEQSGDDGTEDDGKKRGAAIMLVIAIVAVAFALCILIPQFLGKSSFVFIADDVEIRMGAKSASIISSLGSPSNSYEYTYVKYLYYDGFFLMVSDVDGEECICGIYVWDESVEISGVHIGSTMADVKRAFREAEISESGCRIVRGDYCLDIDIYDGFVSGFYCFKTDLFSSKVNSEGKTVIGKI